MRSNAKKRIMVPIVVGLCLALTALAENSALNRRAVEGSAASFGTTDGYELINNGVIGGGGISTGEGYHLLATVGEPDPETMSGGGYALTPGFFVPVQCPASSPPQPEMIGPDISTKNRFLSFTAGDVSSSQGIRVTFDSLPPPHDVWNGAELWVGPTSLVSEAGANVAPTEGFPDFTAATLQCAPFYADWSSLGTIHVFHEGVVPDASYRVDVINEACNIGVSSSYSEALPMTTAIWGDTVLNLGDTPPLPPEGAVNVNDALAVLGRFSSAPGSIAKARADLEPACLDLLINVSDVLSSLAGFVGLNYPFAPTAADPCDSACPFVLP